MVRPCVAVKNSKRFFKPRERKYAIRRRQLYLGKITIAIMTIIMVAITESWPYLLLKCAVKFKSVPRKKASTGGATTTEATIFRNNCATHRTITPLQEICKTAWSTRWRYARVHCAGLGRDRSTEIHYHSVPLVACNSDERCSGACFIKATKITSPVQ